MNQKLPRRTVLLGAALGALPFAAEAGPEKLIKEKLQIQFESYGAVLNSSQVRLKIVGEGSPFKGVVANFGQLDGPALPFFGWSGGAATSFTMPVTKEGLHLVLEGAVNTPVVLRPSAGVYEIRLGSGKTPLRIELSAV